MSIFQASKLKAIFASALLFTGCARKDDVTSAPPPAHAPHSHTDNHRRADEMIRDLIDRESETPPANTLPGDAIPNQNALTPPGHAPGSAKGEILDEDGRKRRDRLTKFMKQEIFARTVLSASTAVKIATEGLDKYATELSAEQKYIVRLVYETRKTAIGRAMTDLAAKNNTWMCIDNYAPGAAYYTVTLNVLSMELKDDGKTIPWDEYSHDETGEWSFKNALPELTGIFYHELTHFMQYNVWNNAYAAEGTRSFDKKLWDLFLEAQANVIKKHYAAIDKSQNQPLPADLVTKMQKDFIQFVLNADGHMSAYEFEKGRLDDGKPMDAADMVAAFGILPGVAGNFMEGRFKTWGEIYSSIVEKNDRMKTHYRAAQKQAEEAAKKQPASQKNEEAANGARTPATEQESIKIAIHPR